MKLLSLIFSLFFISNAFAQSYTISGTVQDATSGEQLLGATVRVAENPNIGTITNEYGFYSLSLEKGNYTILINYIGYETFQKEVTFDQNKKIDFNVSPNSKTLEIVEIVAKKKDENLRSPAMGTEKLDISEISKIPVIFGEKDVLKTIQLLPGVKSAGEGNSGFNVRGGATDQNLILLDEAPVYNASHLLGFFSTFNSDAIKDATIIKGNSPAQYGGRLSSVLDVKMKEGNIKDYRVNGGIGLISSRVSIEGPIQDDKSSFIIAGRRTYADLFLKATKDFKDNQLYFYDLNAKANYKINDKNRIYASGYFGRDILGVGKTFGIDWGNKTGTLRWNSIINSKLFSNTSIIYSDFNYNINIKIGEADFKISSNIRDINLKQDFSYFANPENNMRFGFNIIRHEITPSTLTGTVTKTDQKPGRKSLESALYYSNNQKINDNLSFEYGLRISAYSLIGGDTYNIFDKEILTDSVVLEPNKIGKTYFNLEPRFTANYRLNEYSSIKGGYSRNVQNLHLLSNSNGGSPTDQWIGNSYNIKPETSDQISVGYSRNFNENNYEFGIESYYKTMSNQLDYRNGADINTAPDVESELLYGKGRAYGVELLLKKKEGDLTGWIGYTISKTERQIDGINNNQWYNAKQDRTHDLSIVAIYQLSKKWSVSGLFVYSTGNSVTFPIGKYSINGNTIFQYSDRNADRMPAYHRMDLSFTYEKPSTKRYQSSWNFGIYNIYGRENAYTITFRDDPNDATKTQAFQTSLFKWVPSVTYNFKF